jgi:hypothetical protein
VSHTHPALLALLTLACSATEIEWERVEDPRFVAEDGSYSLELPLGWVRSEHSLTRDGWELQVISFNAGPVLAPADGTAIDLAAPELLVALQDELAAQSGVRVIECRPATLGSLLGFRMHFTQEVSVDPVADPGSPVGSAEIVIYGAVEGATLYAFSFENRSPASFTRDLEVFERLVASFERAPAAQSSP